MASRAVAQAAVFALRQKIMKIESTFPGLTPSPAGRRQNAVNGAAASELLLTHVSRFDNLLGGGLPRAALTEIQGNELRDVGAVSGFALALAGLVLKARESGGQGQGGTILWIGVRQSFAESGFPHAPGLSALSGFSLDRFLVAQAPKLVDALWIAEEAARLKELSAVFLEIEGNPARLDLTATRRLHRRAQLAGRPVFLLRQAARAEPTAAPVRLVVSPAPAVPRNTLAGPLAETIGDPAFGVTIGKSRTALPGQFILEWNPHERAFQERRPENSRSVVSAPAVRPDIPAAAGAVVAFKSARAATAGVAHQPSGQQHPAHRGARRTG